MEFLTTEQAAERLGVTPRRVQAMAKTGRLPASRFGRALMIKESDLALVADRKPGRPPKATADDADQTEEAAASGAGSTPASPKRRASKKATTKKAMKKVSIQDRAK